MLALVLPLLVGCGTASVSGTVTYDGKPVGKGKITFQDVAENGPAVGTDIDEGKYQIKDLPVGKKKVYILAVPGDRQRPIIWPAANQEEVEITRGNQVRDFELKKAAKEDISNK